MARAFDFVANAAPGVKEILTVGKVCWELRESLAGPRRLGPHRGRRRRHRSRDQPARRAARRSRSSCRSGRSATRPTGWCELLSDPALTALNVVTAPEEMPVNETIELVARARAGAQRPARRRDREPGAPGAVHPRRRGGVRRAPRAGRVRAVDPHARDRARSACSTPRAWRCRCGAAARRTSAGCATRSTCPLLLLPYLFVRDHGLRVTRMVAEALGQELGY